MAYYLGRDLDIALLTEHATFGLSAVTTSGDRAMAIRNFGTSGSNFYTAAAGEVLFAPPRLAGMDGSTNKDMFAEVTTIVIGSGSDTPDFSARPENLTAVDLSIGTMDEDVAFIGQRNVLKAEIKKENSVTLTRKKKDDCWSVAYSDARFGLDEDGAIGDGHYQPDFFGYGYRIALRFKDGDAGEVFVLPNACITDYTITLQVDGSQEESITFMSYVNPIITDGTSDSAQHSLLLANADEM
tara:strand:- start:161 stop:883 length:723 start_codon:yes stop_codon:yes gene_type:complete